MPATRTSHRSVMERGVTSEMPWALRHVERLIAFDYKRLRANHAMLAKLATHEDVTVFSSHDPVEFDRLRARGRSSSEALRR
jgi:hypothetical protein